MSLATRPYWLRMAVRRGEGRGGGGRAGVGIALLLGLLAGRASVAAQAPAEGPGSLEYRVKAAYLLNFARYVDWPTEAFSSPDSPLEIGILGDDPFGNILEETVAGRTANGREIVVRRYREAKKVASQLVFIGRGEAPRMGELVGAFAGRPVLTVGESPGFFEHGGGINLVIVEETVRFEVNLEVTETAGLKVSSRMLGLAKAIVHRRPGEE